MLSKRDSEPIKRDSTSNLTQIEKRDNQLWWLAITIIILLTFTVTAVDTYPIIGAKGGLRLSLTDLGNVNGVTLRLSLIVSAFLICTYFRECARSLLAMNRKLIVDLEAQKAAMERKNLELSRMKQLSDVLMTSQDLNSALEVALRMATEVIGADAASIMLLDDTRRYLRIVAARGLPDEVVRETRIKVGEGLAGLVAQEGEPMILDSDNLDDKQRPLAHRTTSVLSAIICPIKVEGEIRGVINVTNRRDGAKYTMDNLNIVATLAQQASMVIQKIELYQNLEMQVIRLRETLEELNHTQAELIQAEKLACIGQLAGGIAHEINNPLHIMLGRAEMLLESMAENTQDRKDVQILYDQSERLALIVRNLLRFARRSATNAYSQVKVNEIIAQTLDLVERQMVTDNIEIVFDRTTDLPKILGNPGELQQVFLNMMLNAYQAMKQSGGRLEIVSHANKENVEVIFSDNGPGIPKEQLTHIFEPFYTTKAEGEGSGLGLSVSYGIVQAHGGRIDVESEVGSGTSFILTLPVAKAAKAA